MTRRDFDHLATLFYPVCRLRVCIPLTGSSRSGRALRGAPYHQSEGFPFAEAAFDLGRPPFSPGLLVPAALA